jgi:hypothetical protein
MIEFSKITCKDFGRFARHTDGSIGWLKKRTGQYLHIVWESNHCDR